MIQKSGIAFDSWKWLSNSRFNSEHCRLIILKDTWVHFKPNCLWPNIRVLCLIFVRVFFQIKLLCTFTSWSIIWLETIVKTGRYTTFDSANVLKIVIFPLIIRRRILHNLRIFWMSRVTLQKFVSFWFFLLHERYCYMKAVFWLYLMSSQHILNHRLSHEPLSVLPDRKFIIWKYLILILNNWKNNVS